MNLPLSVVVSTILTFHFQFAHFIQNSNYEQNCVLITHSLLGSITLTNILY